MFNLSSLLKFTVSILFLYQHFYHKLYDHVLSIAHISVHVTIFHIAIIFIILL